MRATTRVHTTAAGLVPRPRPEAGLLSHLVPRQRRPLTVEQLVNGLREAGVVVMPDLPETSTAPYEVHHSARGGRVDGVALATWMDDEERLVVLQSVRKLVLTDR